LKLHAGSIILTIIINFNYILLTLPSRRRSTGTVDARHDLQQERCAGALDHKDLLWCSRHAGTTRQFKCTRLITAEQVKDVLRRIPGFRKTPRANYAEVGRL
jgi:hypothetical protein